MRHILRAFDIGVGPNLTKANVLDPRWLHSIRKRAMQKIQRASNTEVIGTGSITNCLNIGVCCARITLSVVDRLETHVLLGTTFMQRYISHPTRPSRELFFTTPGWYPYLRYTRPRVQSRRKKSQISLSWTKNICYYWYRLERANQGLLQLLARYPWNPCVRRH